MPEEGKVNNNKRKVFDNIHMGLQKFIYDVSISSYLFGRKLRIVTDHKPFTWLMNLKDPNSKLVRRRLKLDGFYSELQYKKGALNTNAGALSRNRIKDLPCKSKFRSSGFPAKFLK